MENKKAKNRYFLLLILFILLITAAAVWLLFISSSDKESTVEDKEQAISQSQGERFEFSQFYHADGGTWSIKDENILVLKEMKFISASEKEEYTVHEVNPSDHVRIIEARQRWKRVEILDKGKVIAAGWIDAHNVRNAERVDSENE
jgi:hypothetical protein